MRTPTMDNKDNQLPVFWWKQDISLQIITEKVNSTYEAKTPEFSGYYLNDLLWNKDISIYAS